jgi:hypothetical protein
MILFSGIKDCNMDMVKNNSMMVQNIWECSWRERNMDKEW